MNELIHVVQGIIERGLIFGMVVAGVYLASRLIDFDNLAVEGAFGLGGACTALFLSWNIHPWLSLGVAAFVGVLSGLATGLLSTKLRLNNLISGIVITSGLFSITLKIAGSNMTLAGKPTIFSIVPPWLQPFQTLLVLTFFCLILFFLMTWILRTEVGFLLRAAGDSPQMITNVGKSVHWYRIFGLILSNMFAAISGALFVQYSGYFSIWASVGVLIIGLAGMILAEIVSSQFGLALLVGSILYQAIIALTFELQLDQDWNKFFTALLIVVLIIIKQSMHKKESL